VLACGQGAATAMTMTKKMPWQIAFGVCGVVCCRYGATCVGGYTPVLSSTQLKARGFDPYGGWLRLDRCSEGSPVQSWTVLLRLLSECRLILTRVL
jgi:hypothetical protein